MPPPNPHYKSAFNDPESSLEDRCQSLLDLLTDKDYSGYDAIALSTTKFVSCRPGRTEWSLTVTEAMCNSAGNLHGGCAATIMDDLTSTPSLTIMKKGSLDGGTVSRGLNCMYLKGVPAGTKCRVVCEVVKAGRTLVCFRGDLIDERGDVCVTCLHDKVARNREPSSAKL